MRAANYLDLAPYRRSTVGFDRLLDLMNNAAPDAAEPDPPFDIERRADGTYRISVAVPGFRLGELEVVAQQNMLTVSGRKAGENPRPRTCIKASPHAPSSVVSRSPTSSSCSRPHWKTVF